MSDPNLKYEAKMARARWRAIYLKIEITSPAHKAAMRWLQAAASEIYDVAKVTIKSGGVIQADAFDGKQAEEVVSLSLSRDAVLGIKYAIVTALTGGGNGKPSNLLERRDLLEACSGVGPDGKLERIVESEAKLPETDEKIDEDPFLEKDKKEKL